MKNEKIAEYSDTQFRRITGVKRATFQKMVELHSQFFVGHNHSLLFDAAEADMDTTVDAAQKALDTQLSYWQGYATNVAALKEISAGKLFCPPRSRGSSLF